MKTVNNENREVLLRVEHLEQFFKLGNKTLKAVNDVSFEIYKGEVFGLVGESGCGKTTTGRSIIRLYDITGGSVYFRGSRIAAGIRPYKAAIQDAKELKKEWTQIAKKFVKHRWIFRYINEKQREILKNKLIDAKDELKEYWN